MSSSLPTIDGSSSSPQQQQSVPIKLPATCDPPSDSNPPSQAVWLIFGATGHLGRSLSRAASTHGDNVAAVGWSKVDSLSELQSWQDEDSLALLCDVRIRESVEDVVQATIEKWGRVDVVANCVGFGILGACEDQDSHDLHSQFDTNLFGTINILNATLPHFRENRSGRYLIFSSTAGASGVPGLGPFSAAKFAVEGLLESMLYEVAEFNIKSTLIEPAHMRLDEPDSKDMGLKRYSAFKIKNPASDAYAAEHAPSKHAVRMLQWLVDRQPVSAVRSAEVAWQIAHCSYPPLRLLLGSYAVESIRDRLRSVTEEIEDWRHLNFPVPGEDTQEETSLSFSQFLAQDDMEIDNT